MPGLWASGSNPSPVSIDTSIARTRSDRWMNPTGLTELDSIDVENGLIRAFITPPIPAGYSLKGMGFYIRRRGRGNVYLVASNLDDDYTPADIVGVSGQIDVSLEGSRTVYINPRTPSHASRRFVVGMAFDKVESAPQIRWLQNAGTASFTWPECIDPGLPFIQASYDSGARPTKFRDLVPAEYAPAISIQVGP